MAFLTSDSILNSRFSHLASAISDRSATVADYRGAAGTAVDRIGALVEIVTVIAALALPTIMVNWAFNVFG